MTTNQLFGLSLAPVGKAVRRLMIRTELNQIKYQLAHIEETRANDREVERIQQRRQAFLMSELRHLEN